jgi:hypothetical protein
MTLLVLNPSFRLPYVQDWNLNIERALGNDWLLQVGYIGTKGTKLPRFIEANPTVYDPSLSPADNMNFGNVGRNTLLGPAFQQWDFSAIKMIPIGETMNLQLRAEFFNIFNNVNFVLPNNDISSPNFGQIQAAQPGRVTQLAPKFAF